MSSKREWRERFIATATRAGFDYQTIAGLLRKAATLQRLAVAQCNGDWPADNGQRETAECTTCGSYWVPAALVKDPACMFCQKTRGLRSPVPMPCPVRVDQHGSNAGGDLDLPCQRPAVCPDCRTSDQVRALLEASGTGFTPIFGGDPRGYVLKIARPVRVWEYPAGTWRAEILRYTGVMSSESEVQTFETEAAARAWYADDISNGRAESRGDVIGVPS